MLSVPWLGGEGVKIFTNLLLWQNYASRLADQRPGRRSAARSTSSRRSACLRSTPLILLTSGVTVTIAHHALRVATASMLTIFLALTFLLGFLFVWLAGRRSTAKRTTS